MRDVDVISEYESMYLDPDYDFFPHHDEEKKEVYCKVCGDRVSYGYVNEDEEVYCLTCHEEWCYEHLAEDEDIEDVEGYGWTEKYFG